MDNIQVNLLEVSGLKGAYDAVQKPYGKKVDDPKALLYKVAKIMKHRSVMEHIQFQFDITGSSRLELQEHMRQRTAKPTVRTTRKRMKPMVEEYKKIDILDVEAVELFLYKYTVFPYWMLSCKENDKRNKLYAETLFSRMMQFGSFVRIFEELGTDTAKYEMIESQRTAITWTIDCNNMLKFLDARTALDAHFEIRMIAERMADLLCENEEIKDLITGGF